MPNRYSGWKGKIFGEHFRNDVDSLDEIGKYCNHSTQIFPSSTNATWVIDCGDDAHKFSDWSAIQDTVNSVLSDHNVGVHMHIVSINIEQVATENEYYLMEMGYGPDTANVTTIARTRFQSGAKRLNTMFQGRIRTELIPSQVAGVGQEIYARMKGETADDSVVAHIRFYVR